MLCFVLTLCDFTRSEALVTVLLKKTLLSWEAVILVMGLTLTHSKVAA